MFLDLDEQLLDAVKEAGFQSPTAVQEACFEPALDGQDLFVSAETGSGKTAAYLLPTFERLLGRDQGEPLALILVPTRELAQQVLRQAKQLGRFTDLTFGIVSGGTDIKKQIELVKNSPQIIIATPGRLSEVVTRDDFDLSSIEALILDEADRLLDMGFSDEVLSIAEHCLARMQTSMFSATLANKSLRGLAEALLTNPETLELYQTSDKHQDITQQIIFADDKAHKFKLVQWLIENEEYKHCVVFCNSKEQADQVYRVMQQQNISAGILHGDKDQKQRNLVMSKLRREQVKVLIATDVAARGLDIEGMDLVINFQMPRRGDIYVHRIGRTGRAGEKGTAVTLIEAAEFNLMASIERYLEQRFDRRKIKELEGNYKGPKKLKSSGKAAGKKKKKKKK
ncbi:MAG: DEAD/DEAH box helicase [Oleiphilaceae bacterium]|nr:DEAD/DEAH box helicase [Oleiphilaceae bacterium]